MPSVDGGGEAGLAPPEDGSGEGGSGDEGFDGVGSGTLGAVG